MINISDTQQLKTSVTYYGTGSQTNFDFPFDYLRKAFIHVTINDVEVSDYSVDSRTIIFATAPSEGAIINIYRSTATTRLVAWADASVLKASDMTISQVQQLHILEEGQDWSKINSIYLDDNDSKWQGNNHPMKNISDPVDAKDVVTKGYMETVQGGFVMANTALKDEATKQAGIATTKASEAAASASAAKTSETNAASSANMAKRWAEASDSPDNTTSKSAKTWASEAIGSASAAKASETNAKSSETKAANSATTATEKAGVATTKASEASASASAAKTSETNAQNAANAAKTSETNAKNYSENVNVFLPSVSDSGVLSWTNKAGLANPASVNIKGAKGDKGDTGNAATIEVGTVTTGAAGSSASVVNRGDANNAILDFILPKGADGKGSVITVNGKEPDAGGNVNVEEYTHPNSGVTAGTYRSVTVNAQGHVTDGSNPTLAIANGGTGATTAKQACANIGALPLSGGSMSGDIYKATNNGALWLTGGNSVENAKLGLFGKDMTDYAGCFLLKAQDANRGSSLLGTPDGIIRWNDINLSQIAFDQVSASDARINFKNPQLQILFGYQWGSSGTVTFVAPFDTAPIVLVTLNSSTITEPRAINIIPTTTGFQYDCVAQHSSMVQFPNLTFGWLAIGKKVWSE